jgi:hypothetical protein
MLQLCIMEGYKSKVCISARTETSTTSGYSLKFNDSWLFVFVSKVMHSSLYGEEM